LFVSPLFLGYIKDLSGSDDVTEVKYVIPHPHTLHPKCTHILTLLYLAGWGCCSYWPWRCWGRWVACCCGG